MSRIFADIRAVQDRFSPERGVPKYTAEFAEATSRLHPDLVERWLLHEGEPVPPFLLGLLSGGKVGYAGDASERPDILHNLAPFHSVGRGMSEHDLLDRHLVAPTTR